MPSLPVYFGLAGGLGMCIGVMVLALRQETEKFAQQAAFVKRALQLMQTEPKVKELLGDRITAGQATFKDGFGRLDRLHCQVKVPIRGENDNAFLYAYARKKEQAGKFRLYKMEATFGKIEGKKLILMDRTNEDDGPDEEVVVPPIQRKKFEKMSKEEERKVMANWK